MFTTLCFVISILCVTVLCGDEQLNNAVINTMISSDPMYVDLIKVKLPNIYYDMNDIYFSGLKNCIVGNMRVEKEKSIFQFDLTCSKTYLTAAHYEARGSLMGKQVNAKGKMTVTANDYLYSFTCQYEELLGENNKHYLHIKGFKIGKQYGGVMVFDLENLSDGDAEKSAMLNKYFNMNWQSLDKILRDPILDSVFKVFIENLNSYLKSMPID